MNFGEKVRYFRQKRNMTQKELAGDFITRNMLSKIETGDASPSLATIEYLTKKLDLPKGFLLCDTLDAASYERQEFLSEVKTLLSAKKYAACIERIEASELRDDELDFIHLSACFRLALENYRQGRYREARDRFLYVSDHSEKNFYFSDGDQKTAKLYISVIDSFLSDKEPRDNIHVHDPHLNEYLYVNALRTLEFDRESTDDDRIAKALLMAELPILQEPLYAAHIRAKCMIARGGSDSAVTSLQKLYEAAKKQNNRFLLYGICCDLEYCYKLREDYRSAYEMAAEKNAIFPPMP